MWQPADPRFRFPSPAHSSTRTSHLPQTPYPCSTLHPREVWTAATHRPQARARASRSRRSNRCHPNPRREWANAQRTQVRSLYTARVAWSTWIDCVFSIRGGATSARIRSAAAALSCSRSFIFKGSSRQVLFFVATVEFVTECDFEQGR